jgi:hypothetical protein
MIERVGGAALRVYAAHRRRTLEGVAHDAARVQEAALLHLVRAACGTEFGRGHGFDGVRSVAEYQARTPLGDYLRFQPLWNRVLGGERDVTWPGRPRYWVKTSGTTAGDKLIPVTPEALSAHRKGGWDALLVASERTDADRLLGGPLLFLGGCTGLAPIGRDSWVGDLSGLVVRDLPPGVRGRYSPGRVISSIPDWDRRIDAVASLVEGQDLRLVSGMPSWLLILFERVARARRASGRPVASLGECWPNLGVFIHGGVSFAPYRATFEEWMGRPIEYVEVYPASEGFVALQTERTGGLTLMLDYGIFYEFVPLEDLGRARPRRHTVADIELGRPYAVALTTPGGLWSYLLGDTVRFTARDPLRLVITGRTRHFVNGFGENVIVEEIERALVVAAVEPVPSPRSSRWRRGTPPLTRRAGGTTGWSNSGRHHATAALSYVSSTRHSRRSIPTTGPSEPSTSACWRRASSSCPPEPFTDGCARLGNWVTSTRCPVSRTTGRSSRL